MDTKIAAHEDSSLVIGQIGWRYYNEIKKKAMEQEFSWTGLVLSLSIAFFIVIISAFCLNLLYLSAERSIFREKIHTENLYMLETTKTEYIQLNELSAEQLKNIRSSFLG